MVSKKELLERVKRLENRLDLEQRASRNQEAVIEALMHDITDVRRTCGLMGDSK